MDSSGVVEQIHGTKKDGKKHGAWFTYWDGELVSMQTWKNGVQHGVERFWSLIDGQPAVDQYYVNGRVHGRSRGFGGHDNGLTSLSFYQHGGHYGPECTWSDDGRLLSVVYYHQGRYLYTDKPATKPCPYMRMGEGAHHADPNDRTFDRMYKTVGRIGRRPMPLPSR